MKTAAIAIVFIFAFATTAFATTTDEIGGYTSAVIQESGISGEAHITVNTLSNSVLLLVLYNTTNQDPSLSEIAKDAYLIGIAIEKVLKHYPDIKIHSSVRINPNLDEMKPSTKAYLDMSMAY